MVKVLKDLTMKGLRTLAGALALVSTGSREELETRMNEAGHTTDNTDLTKYNLTILKELANPQLE